MGVGGGILFVPALDAASSTRASSQAEATSLLAIIPVAIVGAWRQYGYGNVRLRDALADRPLSPLGVLVGAVIANNVSRARARDRVRGADPVRRGAARAPGAHQPEAPDEIVPEPALDRLARRRPDA